MAEKKIVLVTGGSGFLGQHIVRELQDEVDEIRVFDRVPFENKLGYTTKGKPVIEVYVGNILTIQDLENALKGVTCVIHTAAAIDVRMFPDTKFMKDVNVTGTANVIEACISSGVPYLIFTSTVDVLLGHEDIVDGDESVPYPAVHLFEGYGSTKQAAEQLVLAANGRPLEKGNGGKFRTVCLRPTVFYGENDPYFISSTLKSAKASHGTWYRIGSDDSKLQCSYVGNIAWAHVCAFRALQASDSISGHAYIINDDTPVKNFFDFLEPFLKVRGFRLSSFRLPYFLIYGVLCLLYWLLWIVRPISKVNMQHSPSAIAVVNQTVSYKRSLAESKLNYSPKYTSKESLEKSLAFYKSLKL